MGTCGEAHGGASLLQRPVGRPPAVWVDRRGRPEAEQVMDNPCSRRTAVSRGERWWRTTRGAATGTSPHWPEKPVLDRMITCPRAEWRWSAAGHFEHPSAGRHRGEQLVLSWGAHLPSASPVSLLDWTSPFAARGNSPPDPARSRRHAVTPPPRACDTGLGRSWASGGRAASRLPEADRHGSRSTSSAGEGATRGRAVADTRWRREASHAPAGTCRRSAGPPYAFTERMRAGSFGLTGSRCAPRTLHHRSKQSD